MEKGRKGEIERARGGERDRTYLSEREKSSLLLSLILTR